MFQIVAIPFDAFQALPRSAHRWLLTCFSRYTDKAGKAFPTLRQLAADARMSLATVQRRMAELADLGVFHRERQPGGRYRYILAEAYRPSWPGKLKGKENRGVSGLRAGVSQRETQEANPLKHVEKYFAKSGQGYDGLPDPADRWRARIRSWVRSGGKFWLADWGARPGEAGCFVPRELIEAIGAP